MNFEQANLNDLVAKRSAHAWNTDTIAALQIRYTGAIGFAEITVSGERMVAMIDSDSAVAVGDVDANFGSSGQIAFSDASFDTLGELVDGINSFTGYECVQRHGLRSTMVGVSASTAWALVDVSGSITSTGGITIYWDTNATSDHALSVTNLHTAFADYAKGELPSDPYSVDDGYVHGVVKGYLKSAANSTDDGKIEVYNGATMIYAYDYSAWSVGATFFDYNDDFSVEADRGEILTVLYADGGTNNSDGVTSLSGGIMYKSMAK